MSRTGRRPATHTQDLATRAVAAATAPRRRQFRVLTGSGAFDPDEGVRHVAEQAEAAILIPAGWPVGAEFEVFGGASSYVIFSKSDPSVELLPSDALNWYVAEGMLAHFVHEGSNRWHVSITRKADLGI